MGCGQSHRLYSSRYWRQPQRPSSSRPATYRPHSASCGYASCGEDATPLEQLGLVLGYVAIPHDLPSQARAVAPVGESMYGFGIVQGDLLIAVPGHPPESGLALRIIRTEGSAGECKAVQVSADGPVVWEWPPGASGLVRCPSSAWAGGSGLPRVLWVIRPERSVLAMMEVGS